MEVTRSRKLHFCRPASCTSAGPLSLVKTEEMHEVALGGVFTLRSEPNAPTTMSLQRHRFRHHAQNTPPIPPPPPPYHYPPCPSHFTAHSVGLPCTQRQTPHVQPQKRPRRNAVAKAAPQNSLHVSPAEFIGGHREPSCAPTPLAERAFLKLVPALFLSIQGQLFASILNAPFQ